MPLVTCPSPQLMRAAKPDGSVLPSESVNLATTAVNCGAFDWTGIDDIASGDETRGHQATVFEHVQIRSEAPEH